MSKTTPIAVFAAFLALCLSAPAFAGEPITIPVLVPITGILSLEGTSQRNGALLALAEPPAGIAVAPEVEDTGSSPETALNALDKVLRGAPPPAIAAPIMGSQMLAMIPIATERKVPLITVSGTAQVTEQGSPEVFRFFPSDTVVKRAQARYVVEELKKTRPAILYQTTAYGQSGHDALVQNFKALGVSVVYEEALAPSVKDMLPSLTKALAAGPDVLVLQLHAGPSALFIKQAAQAGTKLPIVAGSAMHQPATAALLEPAELSGVCAESASSPISGGSPALEAFTKAYRAAYKSDPDAFALGQYDGMGMVLDAMAHGASDAASVRDYLASHTYQGVAMSYRSDGKGNMAHDALIICYDGTSRIPHVVKRYPGEAS